MTYFTQKKIKYDEFPKKYLLYCPNTIRKNTEKNEFESLNLFEIVGISRSEKCDEFHQEIFEDMRDLYSEINIKTRFFLAFFIFIFISLYRGIENASKCLLPHESRKFSFETATLACPEYYQVYDYYFI